MSTNHLQTDVPTQSYEDWKAELIRITSEQTGLPVEKISINDADAREWYDDGFTPYCTFRETFSNIIPHY